MSRVPLSHLRSRRSLSHSGEASGRVLDGFLAIGGVLGQDSGLWETYPGSESPRPQNPQSRLGRPLGGLFVTPRALLDPLSLWERNPTTLRSLTYGSGHLGNDTFRNHSESVDFRSENM